MAMAGFVYQFEANLVNVALPAISAMIYVQRQEEIFPPSGLEQTKRRRLGGVQPPFYGQTIRLRPDHHPLFGGGIFPEGFDLVYILSVIDYESGC